VEVSIVVWFDGKEKGRRNKHQSQNCKAQLEELSNDNCRYTKPSKMFDTWVVRYSVGKRGVPDVIAFRGRKTRKIRKIEITLRKAVPAKAK
jgi:hypothetical protein